MLMCWVHVWRAVKDKYSLLKVQTEEEQLQQEQLKLIQQFV